MILYFFLVLFIILFILLAIPTIILSLVFKVLSWFGIKRSSSRTFYYNTSWGGGDNGRRGKDSRAERRAPGHGNVKEGERKKIFSEDEGAYVDYEERKD